MLDSISETRTIARQRDDEAILGSENIPERSHLRAITTPSHIRTRQSKKKKRSEVQSGGPFDPYQHNLKT